MVKLLDILASHQLDTGTEHFDPSTLAITSVDTGNKASNVIPASTTATINIDLMIVIQDRRSSHGWRKK